MKTIDAVMELNATVAGMRTDLTRLVKTVEGNGKVGLCERIATVENNLNDLHDEHRRIQGGKKENQVREWGREDKVFTGVVVLIIATAVDIVLKLTGVL